MNLTDEQKKTVGGWLEQGLSVADVQRRLSEEFSASLTYMEVRFLLDDLALAPKDNEEESDAEDSAGEEPPVQDAEAVLEPSADGAVTVTTDQVVRPGAIASGKVTFSDGVTAAWYLDQFGRLGVVADDKSYKPSQEDLMEFQGLLQQELARMGM
jgi:hypothetical protein